MFDGREWHKVDGAAQDAINALIAIAPATLPSRFLELLCHSNGGEAPLPVQPRWFVLYPAEEIVEIEKMGNFKESFSGFFVIGGNGGGEAIALDLRHGHPFPVVTFDMANCDLNESIQSIAPDFDQFFELIGRED